MIELKIDNDRIEKCKIDGYISATLAELFIGASVLLYGISGEQEKGYEFWRKILTERILPYEKVKELCGDEKSNTI